MRELGFHNFSKKIMYNLFVLSFKDDCNIKEQHITKYIIKINTDNIVIKKLKHER